MRGGFGWGKFAASESSPRQGLNRLSIIAAGLLGFALIAAACVWQQGSELAVAALAGRPPVHAAANEAPATVPATAAPLPGPMLRAEFTETTLVLTGRVPDEALRDAVVARAAALYPTTRVTARIEIVPVTRPRWLATPFPPDLRDTHRATALLQDGRLLIEGETRTDAAKARADAALLAYRTPAITLDNRLNNGLVELGAEPVNDLSSGIDLKPASTHKAGVAPPSSRCPEGRSTSPTDGTAPCSNSR